MSSRRRRPQEIADPATPPSNPTVAQATFTVATRSAPLPTVEELAGYDEILPGAAERIILMAENQARHRMDMESRNLDQAHRRSMFGLGVAAWIGTAGFISAGVAAWAHQPAAAEAIATAVASVLGVSYIYGVHSTRKERLEKTKLLTGQD